MSQRKITGGEDIRFEKKILKIRQQITGTTQLP